MILTILRRITKMAYTKRLDGRKFDETRKIEAKAGIIKKADGSAYFKIGKTWAYAAVYGPRELHPKFLQDPNKGIIRFSYAMMPFSGMGERIRPGPNRRAKEISMVSEKALNSVIDLEDYPNTVVDVVVELPQADAGSRCAGICAASIALADAGIPMRDMVSAVATGIVDDTVVVDLDYEEEHYPEFAKDKVGNKHVADIPVACIPSTGEVTLLQMDGIVKKEQVIEAIELAKRKCVEIAEIQRQAIRDKFKIEEDN
jgi:exosome complex component RRP41